MKSFWCALIAAYALVATCTHAQDSMDNAVKTGGESSQTGDLIAGSLANTVTDTSKSMVTDSGQMSQAGTRIVAGAVAIPIVVAGTASAAPGASLAIVGYNHDDSLALTAGVASAAPGVLVMAPGVALMGYAVKPLKVSPQTMTSQPPAPTPKPSQKTT